MQDLTAQQLLEKVSNTCNTLFMQHLPVVVKSDAEKESDDKSMTNQGKEYTVADETQSGNKHGCLHYHFLKPLENTISKRTDKLGVLRA